MFAKTPKPPYYAVIFTSERSEHDADGYESAANTMLKLAAEQPGYLGVESVRGSERAGVTVSYWSDLDSIRSWKQQTDHRVAQEKGKLTWYRQFRVRICKVEREYGSENYEL